MMSNNQTQEDDCIESTKGHDYAWDFIYYLYKPTNVTITPIKTDISRQYAFNIVRAFIKEFNGQNKTLNLNRSYQVGYSFPWVFDMLSDHSLKEIQTDLKQILLPELSNIVINYIQGACDQLSLRHSI